MYDQNDSSYKRLKEKYDKLLKEIGNDPENLSKIQDMGIRDNGIPDFFYLSDMDRKLDAYLRKNPKTAEFIYRKYQENHSLMKDICDPIPGNPLYVKEVADLLSGYFQYEDIKSEASRLKSEIPKIREDVSSLKEERTTLEKETDELSKVLDTKKKELDELEKSVINIREDVGYKMVMDFIHSVKATMDPILNISQFHPEASDLILGTRTLNKETVRNIAVILKTSSELEAYLKTEDFLSGSKLDEVKAELRNARESLEQSISETKQEQKLVLEQKVSNLIDKAGKLTARIEGTIGADLRTPFRNFSDDYFDLSSVVSMLRIKKEVEKSTKEPDVNVPVDGADLLQKLNDEREGRKKGVFHKN
jgi:vacuolar-type H+-ATPase subunit I/STV1